MITLRVYITRKSVGFLILLSYLIRWTFHNTILPVKALEITMLWLSSLRHVIVGFGYPVAAHCNVTLLPSCTTMSELVG